MQCSTIKQNNYLFRRKKRTHCAPYLNSKKRKNTLLPFFCLRTSLCFSPPPPSPPPSVGCIVIIAPFIHNTQYMVWLKGGTIFVLFSAILCYSGHLDFLVRLKGGAIFCYFGVVGHTIIQLYCVLCMNGKLSQYSQHYCLSLLITPLPRRHIHTHIVHSKGCLHRWTTSRLSPQQGSSLCTAALRTTITTTSSLRRLQSPPYARRSGSTVPAHSPSGQATMRRSGLAPSRSPKRKIKNGVHGPPQVLRTEGKGVDVRLE